MFNKATLFALAFGASAAFAQVTPTSPSGNTVVKAGDDLSAMWEKDTTGAWTDLEVQLMTGDNWNVSLAMACCAKAEVEVGIYYGCIPLSNVLFHMSPLPSPFLRTHGPFRQCRNKADMQSQMVPLAGSQFDTQSCCKRLTVLFSSRSKYRWQNPD